MVHVACGYGVSTIANRRPPARVMVKGPGDAVFKPWTKPHRHTDRGRWGNLTIANVVQVATDDWFGYLPQAGPPTFKSVAGNLLAPFVATEEGLQQVYLQVRESGNRLLLAASSTEEFHVDNTGPIVDIEITNGDGNCGKFKAVDPIEGIYSMTYAHSGRLGLTVTPQGEAARRSLSFESRIPAAAFPAPLAGPNALQPRVATAAGVAGSAPSVYKVPNELAKFPQYDLHDKSARRLRVNRLF